MSKSIVHNFKAVQGRANAQATASGTGTIFDTQGFHSVAFLVDMKTVAAADADNNLAFTVQEGDSALGYDFEDVAADRLISAYTLNATDDAGSIFKFGVTMGVKRYMRVKFTETGTADATFGVIVILGNPEEMPVA